MCIDLIRYRSSSSSSIYIHVYVNVKCGNTNKKETNKTDTETKVWHLSLQGVFNGGWIEYKYTCLNYIPQWPPYKKFPFSIRPNQSSLPYRLLDLQLCLLHRQSQNIWIHKQLLTEIDYYINLQKPYIRIY